MVLVPPQARPSGGTMLGNHEARIRALERPRTRGAGSFIAGALYNDAGIIEGSGFTAEWAREDGSDPGTNYITIRFDTPFSAPGPVMTYGVNNNNNASGISGDDSEYQVGTSIRDPNFVEVVGKEMDGTPNIGGFDFIAAEASA